MVDTFSLDPVSIGDNLIGKNNQLRRQIFHTKMPIYTSGHISCSTGMEIKYPCDLDKLV